MDYLGRIIGKYQSISCLAMMKFRNISSSYFKLFTYVYNELILRCKASSLALQSQSSTLIDFTDRG